MTVEKPPIPIRRIERSWGWTEGDGGRTALPETSRRQFEIAEWIALGVCLAVGVVVAALVLAAEEAARLRGLFGG